MELLVTMSMTDYNKMLADAKTEEQKKSEVELALYWAYRVMDDSLAMEEFLKIVKDRGFTVERKGTKMYVEKIRL